MHGLLLLAHILGATVWTGGHIILATVVLPKALKERSTETLLNFESAFEKVGMPALILQVITGLMLAYRLVPDVSQWFNPANTLAHGIMAKLMLLILTIHALGPGSQTDQGGGHDGEQRGGVEQAVQHGGGRPGRPAGRMAVSRDADTGRGGSDRRCLR